MDEVRTAEAREFQEHTAPMCLAHAIGAQLSEAAIPPLDADLSRSINDDPRQSPSVVGPACHLFGARVM